MMDESPTIATRTIAAANGSDPPAAAAKKTPYVFCDVWSEVTYTVLICAL